MIDYPEVIRLFLHIGIVFLAITMIICLVRAVRGPKLADRIVATNMICVKTILLIVMVAVYLGEGFLVDVAKVSDDEMDEWKAKYPDSFARKVDEACGVCLDGWLI